MEAEHLKSKLNTSSSLLNDWFVIQPLQTHLRAPPQKRPVTVNKERLSHQLDFNRSVEKRVVLRGTKFNQTLKKLKMLEVNQIPKMHAIRANPMNDHTRRSKNADHQNNMAPVIWCLKRNKSMPVIGLEEKQFKTNSQLMNAERLSSKRTKNKEGTEVEKPLNMATSTQPVFNPVTRIVDQGVSHSSKSIFFSANSKRPETAQYSKSDPLAKNTSALMLARDDLHSSLPQNRIRIRTAIPKARSAAASKLNTPQRSPTDQKSFKELLQRAQEDRKAHTATDWKKFSKQTNRHHDLMSSTQQRIATNESNFAEVNDGKTRSKSAFFRAHRESMIKDTTQQVEEEWNPFTEERLPTLEQEMNNQEDHHRIQENDIILASEDLSAQEEELLQKETAPFRGKKKAHIIIQKKPAQNTSKRRVHSLDPEFDTDDVHQLKIRMDDRRLFLRPLPIHMPDISINLIGGKFKTRWRILREKLMYALTKLRSLNINPKIVLFRFLLTSANLDLFFISFSTRGKFLAPNPILDPIRRYS